MIKVTCDQSHKRHDVKEIYCYFKSAQGTGQVVKFTINSVYKGLELIWNLIKSCFGSGIWVNTSNWSNTETWKN